MTEAAKVINFFADILRRHGLLSPSSPTDASPKTSNHPKSVPSETSSSQTQCGLQNFFVDGSAHFDIDLSSLLDFAASSLDPPAAQPGAATPRNPNQDEVIDAILQDKDISLLANVYRGFGAAPPMHEIDENMKIRLKNPMKASEFLERLKEIDVDAHVEGHKKWLEELSNNMESLLNDMLIHVSDNQECNIADCY